MGLSARFKSHFFILLFGTLLILSFQNCSQPTFFSTSSSTSGEPPQNPSLPGSQSQNNGQGYDGKIRIVQHFDPNQKYLCKNQEVPESILYQKSNTEGWFYIKNYTQECQSAPAVKVTGVIYDDVLKQATYKDLIYLPPKPMTVNPLEDPNQADINIYDGVCQDANGLCSLRAAIEQASVSVATSDVSVLVSAGLYKLTQPLALRLSTTVDGHQIFLHGQNVNTTILDGQGLTDLITIDGNVGAASISNMTFQNGSNSKANQGSAITALVGFSAELNITSCKFDRNDKNPDLSALFSGGQINIKDSQFTNNKSATAAAISVFGSKLLLEDSVISNNAGMGLLVQNRTYQVSVKRSSIFQNGSVGIYLYECMDCSIENSLIYKNRGGLMISTVSPNPDPLYNVPVKNSNFIDNGTATLGNIYLSFSQPTTALILSNSVVASHSATFPNCKNGPTGSHQIIGMNNLFDDLSCIVSSGSGNLAPIDPLLGPLQMSGGLTPTMSPLPGSPLIDAGDNASCSSVDQRGLPRPVDKLGAGALCDIGAVELQ